jgi:hypothetical protein
MHRAARVKCCSNDCELELIRRVGVGSRGRRCFVGGPGKPRLSAEAHLVKVWWEPRRLRMQTVPLSRYPSVIYSGCISSESPTSILVSYHDDLPVRHVGVEKERKSLGVELVEYLQTPWTAHMVFGNASTLGLCEIMLAVGFSRWDNYTQCSNASRRMRVIS